MTAKFVRSTSSIFHLRTHGSSRERGHTRPSRANRTDRMFSIRQLTTWLLASANVTQGMHQSSPIVGKCTATSPQRTTRINDSRLKLSKAGGEPTEPRLRRLLSPHEQILSHIMWYIQLILKLFLVKKIWYTEVRMKSGAVTLKMTHPKRRITSTNRSIFTIKVSLQLVCDNQQNDINDNFLTLLAK